jgi:hypothetical protein
MKKNFLIMVVLGIILINMMMFDLNKERSLYTLDAAACESMIGMEWGVILLMDECMYFDGIWRIGCTDSNDTCGGYET